ncbi:MAG TPA: TlyA family RNA methyltransferase [Clostridiales bacterium]|nr:TlyA family RNA methyltransferase [Clostridiales bacterium]
MEKDRLDNLMVKKGLSDSVEKARSLIMAGLVSVNGIKADKAGVQYPVDADIVLKENQVPYVSRGGLKLEKAIRAFGISLDGKTTMDVGASTGGFTDCMLKNGASRVVAVDVGYGQLAWVLRNDERVINLERTNIRYLKPEDIGFRVDFASVDVSFISLRKVIPPVRELLKPGLGEIVCLIKPQFEAERGQVGRHGVVRDITVHEQVAREVISFALKAGFFFKGMTHSPIKGPEGNIEYLCYLSLKDGASGMEEILPAIGDAVRRSHIELG